tara:strand:+ start:2085 stop:2612 length:528 start_codon:yes stop_codon:yes gene_type:complete
MSKYTDFSCVLEELIDSNEIYFNSLNQEFSFKSTINNVPNQFRKLDRNCLSLDDLEELLYVKNQRKIIKNKSKSILIIDNLCSKEYNKPKYPLINNFINNIDENINMSDTDSKILSIKTDDIDIKTNKIDKIDNCFDTYNMNNKLESIDSDINLPIKKIKYEIIEDYFSKVGPQS